MVSITVPLKLEVTKKYKQNKNEYSKTPARRQSTGKSRVDNIVAWNFAVRNFVFF